MRIIVTGATGLIGKNLCEKLIARGEEVVIFSRSPERAKSQIKNASEYVKWDYKIEDNKEWIKHFEDADSVIHLAGENVMAKRWNDEHKNNVLESRVSGTRSLIKALSETQNKPRSFISASAVGYYGFSDDIEFDENSDASQDFLAEVTSSWEKEVITVKEYGLREVRIRIGIVLDKNEGALAKMITPFKFFAGGPLGSGRQWFPWVHIYDVVEIFIQALYNSKYNGAYNAVSPGIIRMKEFSRQLGAVLNRPSIFPVPELILKIAVGQGAEVITNGAKIIPKKTLESGYKFKFIDVKEALKDILG